MGLTQSTEILLKSLEARGGSIQGVLDDLFSSDSSRLSAGDAAAAAAAADAAADAADANEGAAAAAATDTDRKASGSKMQASGSSTDDTVYNNSLQMLGDHVRRGTELSVLRFLDSGRFWLRRVLAHA